MNHSKWMLGYAFFLSLAGCATTPPSPLPANTPKAITSTENKSLRNDPAAIQNWDLKGMIAIRNTHDAWSAHWQWNQQNQNYVINLIGPLGSNSIQLTGSPGKVLLETSDGKKTQSASPETLLEKQLGWRLPVSNLYYWVRGLPVPGIPAQKQLDASQHISVLAQQGWRVEYLRYSRVGQTDLPAKMNLNNAALNVKILISQWQLEK